MKYKNVNFPITLLAQWNLPSNDNLSGLSEILKDWLLDEGSLTARLKSHSLDFKVHVIGEEKQFCSEAEACAVINTGEPILVREVILYCDDVPQVFARSLLPLKSLTGNTEALAHLGEQPLGQVLFNNPSLQRQGLELSSFAANSSVGLLAKSLLNQTEAEQNVKNKVNDLWGRRSIFILENKPLIVAEVFLPSAFAYK